MKTSKPSLKQILIDFLSNKDPEYPPIELRILSIRPFQATDSHLNFIDIASLQDDVIETIGEKIDKHYKITLREWKFVFKSVPNSTEFYFDISADDFK